MPLLEFVGQTSQDRNHIAANTSRLVNCYRVPVNGQSRYVVRAVLGEVAYADTGLIFTRDMIALGDFLFVSVGGSLVRISKTASTRAIGDVVNGESNLSTNNGVLTLAGSGSYYTWDGSEMSQPSTLFGAGSCAFLGQRTIISEYGGRRFQWSGVAAPKTFDALNFATKEARDDDLLRVIAHGGRLYLMGERSIEIWGETEQSGANAFQRLPGAVIDRGLMSYGLVTSFDDGFFFIGDDGIAYVMAAGQMVAVSSRAMEAAIEDDTPTRAFYWEDEGQKFCGVRFANRPSWIFDMSTGEWHERARGTELLPWDVVATAQCRGVWYTATDAGAVNYLARVNSDPDDALRRVMVSNTIYMDGQRQVLAELEVFPNSGNASLTLEQRRLLLLATSNGEVITTADGTPIGLSRDTVTPRDAMCSLRLSTDSGHHWSRVRDKSMGALGRYDKRTIWRALGQGRQFTAEISCAEPADIEFQSNCRVVLS